MWTKLKLPSSDDLAPDVKWTLKRSFIEVVLPTFVALILSAPVYVMLDRIIQHPVVVEERATQLPVNRTISVAIRTIDGQAFLSTIVGRQVINYESGNNCEYFWAGKIAEVGNMAGTIYVDGKYYVDDLIETNEYGMEEAIKFALNGLTIESANCTFGVLSVELEKQ